MWSWVVPYFLDGGFNYDAAGNHIRTTHRRPYNLIFHSQRGHGLSGLPAKPSDEDSRQTTIPLLSQDIHNLLSSPEIRAIINSGGASADLPKPIHSIIGVSQGGAAALAFAATNNAITKSVIACDTSAKTPGGNKAAWAERVRLVYGHGDVSDSKGQEYAANVGMKTLADVTLPRWFPSGSPLSTEREVFLKDMVSKTDVRGFVAGSQALGDFDLVSGPDPLYESQVERVLLLAGSLDGGGKVGQGLEKLKEEWGSAEATQGRSLRVEYTQIQGSGHLPMVDQPERFCEEVGNWLAGF
jgi:pimeloyl-ACP methyl ester carboxylesterase